VRSLGKALFAGDLPVAEITFLTAAAAAEEFSRLFSFAPKEGTSSVFAGSGVEIMKRPYLGARVHIAIHLLQK
jgi:hypothetical protein